MRRNLLLGTPSWVLPGASLDIDFAHNRAWCQIGGQQPISNLVACSRASSAYVTMASGLLVSKGANVLAQGDLGLGVWQASANLFTNSECPNGLTDVPLNGNATANGSTHFNLLPGIMGTGINITYDGVNDSFAYKKFTGTAGQSYTLSVFVRMADGSAPAFGSSVPSNAANSFALRMENSDINPTTYMVTPMANGVYRVSCSLASAVGTANANYGIGKYHTNAPIAFVATGYQLENSTFATPYIPTTASTITRAADVVTLQGAALAAALTAKAFRSVTSGVNIAVGARLVAWDNGGLQYIGASGNTSAQIYNGATAITEAVTAGGYSGLTKTAADFDTTSYSILANGGVPASAPGSFGTLLGAVIIGNNATGNRALNGYLLRSTFSLTKGAFDAATTGSNPQ